jgi:hypothetical protein
MDLRRKHPRLFHIRRKTQVPLNPTSRIPGLWRWRNYTSGRPFHFGLFLHQMFIHPKA